MTMKHVVTAPARGMKSLTRMVFNRSGNWSRLLMPRRVRDYERAVGDGLSSSVVVAPVMWMARTFPEAPVQVLDEEGAPITGHDMVGLLRRPNPFYSGVVMWMATIASWALTGDAYWLKIRNGTDAVVELWWTPSILITPESDRDTVFITHYTYRPGDGQSIRVENDDIVHFRYGLDPENPRRGLSPLKSVLREVFTDDEAAAFTAALLNNMGVPGVIVSPEGDHTPDGDDVAAVKDYVDEEFTGDRRGKPLVMSGPTKVAQFGFSPAQLDLKALRRIPEERVSGVLGVPAIVAGLGAGLDRSTFANYGEARAAGFEDCIIPTQRLFGEDLWHQLLPDFDGPAASRETVGWDRSQVRVLQEDRTKEAERAAVLVKAGIWTRKRALLALGDEADDAIDDVYLLPISVVTTPADEPIPPPAPIPDPAADPPSEPPTGAIPPELDPAKTARRGARRAKALTTAQTRLGTLLARDVDQLTAALAREIQTDLATLGQRAADAYLSAIAGTSAAANGHTKDDTPTPNIDALLAALRLDEFAGATIAVRYERSWPRTAHRTVETINAALDLDLTVSDTVASQLAGTGRDRVRLLDLADDTRTAITRAIGEGADAGDNPTQTARRIRQQVPAGRFRQAGPAYRAELIARTETLEAQRVGSLAVYRDSGLVPSVTAIDGTDDEDCAARNGQTFTLEEAGRESEHPNGTLAWAPNVAPAPAVA